MLSDPITQPTTGQSIKVNGRKQGPRSKKTNTNLPRCQENCILMSKRAPAPCSSSKGSLCYWTEWKQCSTAGGSALGQGAASELLSPAPRKLRAAPAPTPSTPRKPSATRKGTRRRPDSGPAPWCWQAFGWLCGERAPVWAGSWNGNSVQTASSSCNSFWGRVFNIFFLFDLEKKNFL